MFDLLSESNRKFSIVFTKIDKCSKTYLEELEGSMQSLMKSYNKHFSQFFFTSAKKFEGIIDIQKDIYALSKQ
jgi:GTP-binding protein EngB required for normal cell division